MRTLPKHVPFYLSRPLRFWHSYDPNNFRADLIAGATVAVLSLPQAISFTLIAQLPPEMGIYTAIVGAILAALWGSSNQTYTGPTNAISLLVLSTLLATAPPHTPEFIIAAGLLAVMVGVFQLFMGLAELGMLVNFVSHSVIVGFSTGAGVLIALSQLRALLKLDFSNRNALETIMGLVTHIHETHLPTAVLGIGTIILIIALRKINPKIPGSLVSLLVTSLIVFALNLDEHGVMVIGHLPSQLPPLTYLPFWDLDLIARLSTGALAVGAISLVQTTAVSRALATQTGQRLDSNQEFVGQGLANIGVGLLSGYPCSGSFSVSTVNYKSGARTSLAAITSGVTMLIIILTLAPLAAYLPRAAMSGTLLVTAYGMLDKDEIKRILQGTRGDSLIMAVTFFGTLFLQIEFAVLAGILLSFALYILKTSTPKVYEVLPDTNFKHFIPQPEKPSCPQLAVIDILGDLYFGAVSHIEKALYEHMSEHPSKRYLLLRMHSVNQCDFSGIHTLESIVQSYRDRHGDVFMVRVKPDVMRVMKLTGFYNFLGADNFLSEDKAIEYLFHKLLDPIICIYECNVRIFKECQNLPRPDYPIEIPLYTDLPAGTIITISPHKLWEQLHDNGFPPVIIDVREPREFKRGHIPQAELKPLPKLMVETLKLPLDTSIILVGRGERRSVRAAYLLRQKGFTHISILQGGMLAWEAAELLEAVE